LSIGRESSPERPVGENPDVQLLRSIAVDQLFVIRDQRHETGFAKSNRDSRRDVEAAEKNLDKLDQSLAGGWQSSFYTASGVSGITTSMSTGLLVSARLSGMRIDVSA